MKDLPAFILSIALIRCLIKLLFLFLEKKKYSIDQISSYHQRGPKLNPALLSGFILSLDLGLLWVCFLGSLNALAREAGRSFISPSYGM